MSSKKSIYNRAIRQIRTYLADELKVAMPYKNSVVRFAQLKYGVTITKRDAQKWLVKLAIAGEFDKWPIQTKKTKENKHKIKSHKKRCNEYEEFLMSPYWHKVRTIILERDNYTCIKCGNTTNLHVHHLTYANHLDELNHLDNLVTLCKLCHKSMHPKKKRIIRGKMKISRSSS